MNIRGIAIVTAATGAGLAGGVFFAFSSFVMTALRKLPPAQGVASMQSINRQAPTPVFMTLLFGTAAVSIGLGVHALANGDQPATGWVVAASACYLTAIGLTAAYHVPRNNRLATFDPTTAEAARYWTTYVTQWTTANHLRAATCALAAVGYTIAYRASR